MDLGFCGIIDIVLVILLLIVVIIGYKKGFLKKAIGLIGLIVALVVAFVFCQQLAGWFKESNILYGSIYDGIYANAYEVVTGVAPGTEVTIKDALINMGVPEIFAGMFANSIGQSIDVDSIAVSIATYFTGILMNIICFLILFVGVFIAAIILKIIANILRGNAIIHFIDGLLGIVLYGCLFMVFVYTVFTIFKYMENQAFFAQVRDFLVVDMQLDNPEKFRLSKYLYEHNIIYSILHIFF